MKIGARILKTGIAIILALTISQLSPYSSPAFAGIAAIFAMQPTIYRSYRTVIEQIQGNVIGAVIAILFVIAFGNHAFFVGLACMLTIMINVKLKTQNTVTLAVVTVIAIMESQSGNFFDFALYRFSSVMLGILSAFVVNLLFLPPKYETKLYHKITSLFDDITKWIRISSRNNSEHAHIKNEISNLKEQMLRIEQLYLMYKEEKELFKRDNYTKARKLVVYRQMVVTTKKALDILKKLNKYENQYLHSPYEFQLAIRSQIDYLMVQHEHIHLKYIRKTRTTVTFENDEGMEHEELLALFMDMTREYEKENNAYLYHMMSLLSSLIEYEENIRHLDTLISSFLSFHTDDEEMKLETS
mgnify:FL=1